MLLPALGLMLALPAAAPQEHVVVMDIRSASAMEVAAFKQYGGVHWWLEMGTRLVVGGEEAAVRALDRQGKSSSGISALDPRDLALRAIGCDPGEPRRAGCSCRTDAGNCVRSIRARHCRLTTRITRSGAVSKAAKCSRARRGSICRKVPFPIR